MRKLLASTVFGAFILVAVCCAHADLRPPFLYQVKVGLSDGTSIAGASYGLEGVFVGQSSSKRVKSVTLSHANGTVKANFLFFDDPETVTYERPAAAILGHDLNVFTEYAVVHQQPGGEDYYWVKKEVRVPLVDILQIDTIKNVGKGFAIFQDPAWYAKVKEPYLLVEDCGLGCPAKLFSEDRSISREALQELWDKYLDCKYRLNPETSRRMDEVMSKYHLKILIDPFCID